MTRGTDGTDEVFKDDYKRIQHSRFLRHTSILVWKSYLQRQRRWRYLLLETLFAVTLFMAAIYIANPIFLIPLQAEPEPPLTANDILSSLPSDAVLGYAPKRNVLLKIMRRAGSLLNRDIINGESEDDLRNKLLTSTKKYKVYTEPIIWVIWTQFDKYNNDWKFTIRSSERARYETRADMTGHPNPHLRAGFLAVQLAISQAIVEHGALRRQPPSTKTPHVYYVFGKRVTHWFTEKTSPTTSSDDDFSKNLNTRFNMRLVSMPVSPLMQEDRVRKAISIILLCFTLALIPPVLETEALVVNETANMFKKSLRIHSVDYSAMYLGWMIYAHLTAIPICFLAAITLILIFRWIHLVFAMMLVSAYLSVMIMTALIMAMFHSKAWLSCVWSTLFTLVLTYLAELLVHHQYDEKHKAIAFLLHVFIPPLGLVNAFNSFALLQTGHGRATITSSQSLVLTIGSWSMLILIYFGVLMLMQRTVRDKAIGGQVSWKSIIFKKVVEDVNKLRPVETPTGRERENLQEVDEHVAKAISFRNVSKSIMAEQVLKKITLDVYRGEFTMFFCERVQEKMVNTIEDLLTGLTFCDEGIIYVLGHLLGPEVNFMNTPHMMGYCHRSDVLIDDLTVEEHLLLYLDICLWQESSQYITEYGLIRERRLLIECNLERVKRERVRNLSLYYRAQLCWAIALLLEPRVIIIPNLVDHPDYVTVIRDKIMTYKKYLTIVNICFASIQLEYADRVFVFDSKILAFGGTPAYMFFKYGREYRVRLTLRSDGTDDAATSELISRAAGAGATVRAHYGSLLILRLPVTPTEIVADLVQDFTQNANKYNITSLNITVADSEEIYKRTIYETRTAIQANNVETPTNKEILRKIAEPRPWKHKTSRCTNGTHLRNIAWKVFSFHVRYRLFMILTMTTAVLAGIFLGLTFCTLLSKSERDEAAKQLLHRDVMTVESMAQKTILVIRTDNSEYAMSIANAYVLSEPNMTEKDIRHMSYTALSHSESLTEYLVTRAIDSPQMYVYMYAYGLDVKSRDYDVDIQVLYSPLHFDQGAASRSMAKAYTSLLRFYAMRLNATIQVTDDPLYLDLTPWIRYANQPPLLVQFLLILSVAHVTFLPSKEHGMIRHVQSNARNFSPARYWFTLYFCDLVLYWVLMVIMTLAMFSIIYLLTPSGHFYYEDLFVVPFMLIVYGVVCIPQAYLFTLGPRVALNVMTYIIVNLILGETTVLAKIFYGNTYSFAVLFMRLSPQFNLVYAIVKMKQIFLYNSECIIFEEQDLCFNNTLHKCCQTCGILQECFSRKTYLGDENGITEELMAMVITTFIYIGLLLLIEYDVFKRIWRVGRSISVKKRPRITAQPPIRTGAHKERKDVMDKMAHIKTKKTEKVDTFGEYLLAHNVSKTEAGFYTCYNVYLGLSKGDALALSGLKRHGRLKLCDILAGYDTSSDGTVISMSKWRSDTQPHMFARSVSYSSGNDCLPPWMTVADSLELIALLRGVPRKYAREEVLNHIEVLELTEKANTLISRITLNERTRLNFAAAVIGAPPIIVLDECSAHQKFSVRRVMYYILYHLRKREHAILISASDVESHLPVTNKLAIMLDGMIYDVDTIDNLLIRYSKEGYTVVVHLKEEVVVENVIGMFCKYFSNFSINDATEVLVNVQVLEDLDWDTMFQRMESLKNENQHVYSYIITAISIDYIYNSIINNERGNRVATRFIGFCTQSLEDRVVVSSETLNRLVPFEQKYDITKLKELPWSVIFHK